MEKAKRVTDALTTGDFNIVLKKFGGTEPVYAQLGSERDARVHAIKGVALEDDKVVVDVDGPDLWNNRDLSGVQTVNTGAFNGLLKDIGGERGVYVRFQNDAGETRLAGVAQAMGGQETSPAGKLTLRTRDNDTDGLVIRTRDVHRMGSGTTEEVPAGDHPKGAQKTSDGKPQV